jgi:hypothetical protein
MSVIAVFVNCALIGFSGLALRLFPGYSTADRIVFIVILEVIIIGSYIRYDERIIRARLFNDCRFVCSTSFWLVNFC